MTPAISPAKLLEFLEVPDCGCRRDPLPCGCADSDCDCPIRLPPPCAHILAKNHAMTIEEWAADLKRLDQQGYSDRPLDPEPARVLTREARVTILVDRETKGYALWHAGDILPEHVDELGRQVALTPGNFRPRDAGIKRMTA